MAKGAVKYAVINAFTDTPFKGNPAGVCYLEDEGGIDEQWMQSVAKEFNTPVTAFLVRAISTVDSDPNGGDSGPRFHLLWFSTVAEVKFCGHATMAAAHFLLTSGLVRSNKIEFVTQCGVVRAEKIRRLNHQDTSNIAADGEEKFSIELDFPMIPVVECNSTEIASIPEILNGASVISIKKTTITADLIVELSSGKEVADVHPNFAEVERYPGRGVIVTGPAPAGSGFDFFTRFFCPKLGINEDHVCGSAHCALTPYWSKKLEKQSLVAYQASSRGGVLRLHFNEKTQRVQIQGEAITIMVGTLLV